MALRSESSTGLQARTSFGIQNEDDRLWVVFDWDEEGYNKLLSDPEASAIFQAAGVKGKPETAELAREHDA